MKRRIFALAVSLALLLSLTGCVGGGDSGAPRQNQAVSLTFPEGFTVREIAQRLEDHGVCTGAAFIAAVQEAEPEGRAFSFLTQPERRPYRLEGYLFPDTYDFYVGEGAQKALRRFTANLDAKLTTDDYARAGELGMTIDEVLTLASIIQAETGEARQMGNVSSVLHNRLNGDYTRLECDSTTFYLREDVRPYFPDAPGQFDALYDTYTRSGLPLGPICSPGMDAIQAALFPTQTDYLYFVTSRDGVYYYAKTYEEHQANCRAAGISYD